MLPINPPRFGALIFCFYPQQPQKTLVQKHLATQQALQAIQPDVFVGSHFRLGDPSCLYVSTGAGKTAFDQTILRALPGLGFRNIESEARNKSGHKSELHGDLPGYCLKGRNEVSNLYFRINAKTGVFETILNKHAATPAEIAENEARAHGLNQALQRQQQNAQKGKDWDCGSGPGTLQHNAGGGKRIGRSGKSNS